METESVDHLRYSLLQTAASCKTLAGVISRTGVKDGGWEDMYEKLMLFSENLTDLEGMIREKQRGEDS